LDGQALCEEGALNLVREAGYVFRTPKDGTATKQYVGRNGETYYLQAILLSLIDAKTRRPLNQVPALIHRHNPHPPEFDNVIEVIAPNLRPFLGDDRKEWFALEGPFDAVQTVTSTAR
jgi:hypothetical protein